MTDETDNPRLFLGVPLSDAARNAIRAALGEEPLPGRIVPPANWHLTLRFLGDTSPDAALRLRDVLRRAPLGRVVELTFEGLGAFPRAQRASVVWVGISRGARELGAIARETEARVREAGFPAERRPFAAHLTLSRVMPPRDLRAVLERVPPTGVRETVTAVVLYRSHLGRGPARYEEVERFPLAP